MYLLSHLLFFYIYRSASFYIFFFFNDTATTEIYTLSLHDALPISVNPTAGCTTNCASTPSTPVTPGTPALTVTKANPGSLAVGTPFSYAFSVSNAASAFGQIGRASCRERV